MGGRGSGGGGGATSGLVRLPIDVAKHYTRLNPYNFDSDPDVAHSEAEYMRKLEQTLRAEGWKAFKNNPVLEVGESGKHGVISDGNHRIWAAAKIGLKNVPIILVGGEDNDWARAHGVPTEKRVQAALQRRTKRGK